MVQKVMFEFQFDQLETGKRSPTWNLLQRDQKERAELYLRYAVPKIWQASNTPLIL